jgi:RHS repeat-associated protein
LEAIILDATGTTTGVINDQFGNGVAAVSGGTVTWNLTRVGAYGPLPGIQAQTLTDVSQLAAATAWRSHRIDPTGFYWLGARYYEPTSGRFLSADPMGHAASPSLYDYAGGDPVNGFDPDGRCATTGDSTTAGLLRADMNIYRDVNAVNEFNSEDWNLSPGSLDPSQTAAGKDRITIAPNIDLSVNNSGSVDINEIASAITWLRQNSPSLDIALSNLSDADRQYVLLALAGETGGGERGTFAQFGVGKTVTMADGRVLYPAYTFAHEVGHLIDGLLQTSWHQYLHDPNQDLSDRSPPELHFGGGGLGNTEPEQEAYAVRFANQVSFEVKNNTGRSIGYQNDYWEAYFAVKAHEATVDSGPFVPPHG